MIAILLGEPGWKPIRRAIFESECVIPAPVLTELSLVTTRHGEAVVAAADEFVGELDDHGAECVAFEKRHTVLARNARDAYGKGNGTGGLLNFGDLMVYAIAKDLGLPLLCTGADFASTDLAIHPASRIAP